MVAKLALVWLSSAASLQAHQVDLNGWARAEGVQLSVPDTSLSASYDPAIAEGIEVQLESTRTAVVLEQANAAELLAQTYQLIAAHPEIPQSAWLLAECHRQSALLLSRASNTLEAAAKLAAANALDGPRAEVQGERSLNMTPLASVEIDTVGPRPTDEAYFDGEPSTLRRLSTAGMHHVRVIRGDSVLYANWLEVAPQGGQLVIPLNVSSCSADDLFGVQLEAGRPHVPEGVACPDWLAAIAASDDHGVELARCHGEVCEDLQRWPVRTASRTSAPPSTGAAWYVWPLVGASVVLGTSVVLWQTGVFDNPKPPERTFIFNGPADNTAVLSF